MNRTGWPTPVSRLLVALLLGWVSVALSVALAPVAAAGDAEPLRADSPGLDLGTQPLDHPAGVIGAVMARDRILRNALQQAQEPLQIHRFHSGLEMVAPLAEGRLDAGLLGDMPTLLAACNARVWIVGLVKQGVTALVAKGVTRVEDLVGRRIGYVEASNAHRALLQGLATVGLGEGRVRLIPLRVDTMTTALEDGTIDAFAAWEPQTSIALANSRENRIVFQAPSTSYLVISRPFASHSPEAARQLTASLVRAIDWMRRSRGHQEQAARWVLADAAAFSGRQPLISVAQVVAITRRDILAVPSAPAIQRLGDGPPLKNDYQFLASLQKLPAGATWEGVAGAFDYDGISEVLGAPRQYRLTTFDCED